MDTAHKTLLQLFSDEQAYTWKEDPLAASYEGQRTYDERRIDEYVALSGSASAPN